mmetsp:Transcript_43804/g.78714  ORF Transcript_43804/g.78714 Transcript_43804/m.78714 type:complete len:217 (-) Transcript_43804:1321-1971(-)
MTIRSTQCLSSSFFLPGLTPRSICSRSPLRRATWRSSTSSPWVRDRDQRRKLWSSLAGTQVTGFACKTATWPTAGCRGWRRSKSRKIRTRSIQTTDCGSQVCRRLPSLCQSCRMPSKSRTNHQKACEQMLAARMQTSVRMFLKHAHQSRASSRSFCLVSPSSMLSSWSDGNLDQLVGTFHTSGWTPTSRSPESRFECTSCHSLTFLGSPSGTSLPR